MSGYTPLFESILLSSIWDEASHTRLLFITLLARADKDGVIEASVPGLARLARITMPECQEALEVLSNPDLYSRSPEHEGRRIEKIEGGWRILNHGKYRAKAKSRAEYMRKYREEKRKNQREKNKETETLNTNTNSVTEGNMRVTGATVTRDLRKTCLHEFLSQFWPNVPNKLGKGLAREAYIKSRIKGASKEAILRGLETYRKYEEHRRANSNGDYKPLHPTTWLNQERWEDELPTGTGSRGKELPNFFGKVCGSCGMPARHKATGSMGDNYYCIECIPAKAKERYQQQGYNIQ
jgi:hypothetical protein